MDANDILFRCSSLGHLMVEPKSKTEQLSEGTITHLTDVYVSNMFNRFEEVGSKFTEKGSETEEDSITIVSRITKQFFKKNEEFLKNDFIKGTPDLFQGENIYNADVIRDTKSSWSIFTFFRSKKEKLKKIYYWQMQGYMWLTGAKVAYIDYCLNNTPFSQVEAELRKESYKHPEGNTPNWIEAQIIANHTYDIETFEKYLMQRGIYASDENTKAVILGFVPLTLKQRHFSIEVKRNDEDIEKLKNKITICIQYIQTNLIDANLNLSA